MLSPLFDDDFGLLECVEYFAVEQLIPEAGIEALAVPAPPCYTSQMTRLIILPVLLLTLLEGTPAFGDKNVI